MSSPSFSFCTRLHKLRSWVLILCILMQLHLGLENIWITYAFCALTLMKLTSVTLPFTKGKDLEQSFIYMFLVPTEKGFEMWFFFCFVEWKEMILFFSIPCYHVYIQKFITSTPTLLQQTQHHFINEAHQAKTIWCPQIKWWLDRSKACWSWMALGLGWPSRYKCM